MDTTIMFRGLMEGACAFASGSSENGSDTPVKSSWLGQFCSTLRVGQEQRFR